MRTPYFCPICGLRLKEIGLGEIGCKNLHVFVMNTYRTGDWKLILKQTL